MALLDRKMAGALLMTVVINFFLVEAKLQQPARHVFRPYDAAKQMKEGGVVRVLRASDRGETRTQPRLPHSVPFPCPRGQRSRVRPSSVHRLRPGDIDLVAALGDSLIAGNGAMENYALGTFIEHRGVSWCAGGDGSWREYLTLPNILKEFNPGVRGYSEGKAQFPSPPSGLNLAFPVSVDEDALTQAQSLVSRIRQDPTVNFHKDWKMVTIFFGANDLCSSQCFHKQSSTPAAHSYKLMMALDYLHEHLPRTFVNLIPVIDATVSVRVKRSLMCRMLHRLFCACFHQSDDDMSIITSLARQYQFAENQLISSGRYNKKEDFTVVIQPFMKFFNAPLDQTKRYSEVIDISYITHDCFHFSQKGHALAANMLWNNLLEPVGQKTTKRPKYIMEKFYCPTEKFPYLFTYNNSMNFFLTGSQF